MRTYYFYYDEEATINYLYLFLFHRVAEANKKTRLYNTIKYNSLDDLVGSLNEEYKRINSNSNKKVVSKATLSRVLNSDPDKNYFSYDKENKTITLQNNFTNAKTRGCAKFIKLTDREIEFLLLQNEKLLYSYYLFMKYYCGYSGRNYTDFTANQYLEACKYSTTAGSYKNKLSGYNSLLVKEQFIAINKFRFNGKERNGYSILDRV